MERLKQVLESEFGWVDLREFEENIIIGLFNDAEVKCILLAPNQLFSCCQNVDYIAIRYEESFIYYKTEDWKINKN